MNYEMVISTALDGEQVDLNVLRGALASEDGRKMLASFVLLRAEVAADDLYPSHPLRIADMEPARYRSLKAAHRRSPTLAPVNPSWHHRLGPGRRIRIGVAAALATLAMVCAFWFGTFWRSAVPYDSAGRTVNSGVLPADRGSPDFLPRDQAAKDAGSSTDSRRSYGDGGPSLRTIPAEPPKATRVLRYLPGTEWHPGF